MLDLFLSPLPRVRNVLFQHVTILRPSLLEGSWFCALLERSYYSKTPVYFRLAGRHDSEEGGENGRVGERSGGRPFDFTNLALVAKVGNSRNKKGGVPH